MVERMMRMCCGKGEGWPLGKEVSFYVCVFKKWKKEGT